MSNMTVANTIRDQLGAMTLMIIGAKNLVGSENSLSFRVGKNPKRVTHIKIELNGLDLYDLTFYRMTKKLTTLDDVYVDKLHASIEEETHLYTHL